MDFRPNIERGMAWLDETRPGWEHRINLDKLNLESRCNCLLGQEFDLEARSCKTWNGYGFDIALPLLPRCDESYGDAAEYYGFMVSLRSIPGDMELEIAYSLLTEAWTKAILERLQKLDIRHDVLEQYKDLLLATAG